MNMWELIYTFTTWVARIHERVLRINDAGGWYFDDKQLHFIVFGIFGMALIFVLYPLFKMLAKHEGLLKVYYSERKKTKRQLATHVLPLLEKAGIFEPKNEANKPAWE